MSRAATTQRPAESATDQAARDGGRGAGRHRVVITGISPEVEAGRYPAKRAVGETLTVEADVFTDGHDEISSDLVWRRVGDGEDSGARQVEPMAHLVNDRWSASFVVTDIGRYAFTVRGWVDRFKTWVHDLAKRVDAGQDVAVDLLIGAGLVEEAVEATDGPDADRLRYYEQVLRGDAPADERAAVALQEELTLLMRRRAPRRFITTYPRELEVVVDPPRARFSTWYELFPRSASPEPGRHGRFRDVEERMLPYIAALGFDVLYLPPVHPIGETARKGRDNYPAAEVGDVGSPWAIGSEEGGHKAIHPELGTMDDFQSLVDAARTRYGIDVALDIAFQCSPDHPYVREHPEWFKHRPDGTIQYAENPPKKYQDIYPFDFETDAWEELWEELKSIFTFWIDKGVRIFRVDNPHTKPFPFWEWCIGEVKAAHPETIFLSEAFTRPKVMAQLAKVGFTQSYTYFAWRNDAWNLREYFTELTRTGLIDYFRPNAWPNTPDILTEFLQHGGRPAFVQRLLLAATLTANYGIYGPAFELQEHVAARPGSEEYLHSEKYEIRHWDLDDPRSLREILARVNRVRREHPALQSDRRLHFHTVDNPQLLAYSKSTETFDDVVLCVVNTDPHWTQSGWLHLDLHELGLLPGQTFDVHDLITGARYRWQDSSNYVELNPEIVPAHVFEVRAHERTERDFPTYA